MNLPEWVWPAAWGVIGGVIAAMIVGFAWGGWVTGRTATDMEAASAGAAILEAFTPLCVLKADQESELLGPLNGLNSSRRAAFVIEAGWVDNVSEKYRTEVAEACAVIIVEGMAAD